MRVATFLREPVFDDVDRVVARLVADLAWCEARGVDLAVFPECYLQGYASDAATVERRALALDGTRFGGVLKALSSCSVDLVLGFSERRAAGLFNSAAHIRRGQVLGTYAKRHPNEAAFQAGSDSAVFERNGLLFGINICNDANYADCALQASRQGARLLCYPLNNLLNAATADQWRDKSVQNLRQRALDTGCWVVSADVVGRRGGQISHGCACVIRPDGSLAARVEEGDEGAVIVDID